jgi:hypothetical protein
MKAHDKQARAPAYNSKYLGFKQRYVFKVVRPEPGVRIHDTLTRLKYKEDDVEFSNALARYACAEGGIGSFLEFASKNPTSLLLF